MNDLIKKSVAELKKLEEESRAELFALKFQSAMGNLEKPHRISELRKQIARILTVLSTRKNAGENTEVNVKINLSETYAKIEKESQEFSKVRKAKIEKMMAEQEMGDHNMSELMDLPLPDIMDIEAVDNSNETIESKIKKDSVKQESKVETKPIIEKEIPKVETKMTVEKDVKVKDKTVAESQLKPTIVVEKSSGEVKPTLTKLKVETKSVSKPKAPKAVAEPEFVVKSSVKQSTMKVSSKDDVLKSLLDNKQSNKPEKVKETSVVKKTNVVTKEIRSLTDVKADIKIPKFSKTATSNNIKAEVSLNAKEKLAAMKNSLGLGTAKGRGSGINIDITGKAKDPNAPSYTYGTNWKENRDKIVASKTKTTSDKSDSTTVKKETEKK